MFPIKLIKSIYLFLNRCLDSFITWCQYHPEVEKICSELEEYAIDKAVEEIKEEKENNEV